MDVLPSMLWDELKAEIRGTMMLTVSKTPGTDGLTFKWYFPPSDVFGQENLATSVAPSTFKSAVTKPQLKK